MEKLPVKEALKTYAKTLGFAALGVAGVEPFYERKAYLRKRKEAGLLSPLLHENLSRLLYPQQVFPGISSIIVGILPYYHAPPVKPKTGSYGTVSCYAWGLDYHQVMRERLGRLQEYLLQRCPGAKSKVFVDGGPLLEKALAVRAGLGFWGKNALLITEHWGSFVFIGEMGTDIYLEPDLPITENCGDCQQCVIKCPTGALNPYSLNPFLCISHATMWGRTVPEEVGVRMGRKIWGCDDCQMVCPHNQGVSSGLVEFAPHQGIGAYPSLDWILSLTAESFQEKLGHTALGWQGRDRLRKNVFTLLKNWKGEQDGETDLC